jgi:hypothetical protein
LQTVKYLLKVVLLKVVLLKHYVGLATVLLEHILLELQWSGQRVALIDLEHQTLSIPDIDYMLAGRRKSFN